MDVCGRRDYDVAVFGGENFFSLSFEFGINIKKKYAYNFILFWYKNSPFS